jgi:GMP reductase
MAKALSKFQMPTCLHKHYSISRLVDFFSNAAQEVVYYTFYTLGILEEDFSKFKEVYKASDNRIQNVCIDVANGYSAYFVSRVKNFRDSYPEVNIMAGNVATPEMVQELIFNGVDLVKIGIGPGSVCTTRRVAGVGCPQLSAVIECADAAHGLGGHVCSDGGCQMPGDVAKAFGGGADFVMLGGMFAGCDECEGEWEYGDDDVKKSFRFYGMSSREAMDRHNGGVADYRAPEGKLVSVAYKGLAEGVVQEVLGGLRSACSYVGAMKLKDLSKCTTFVKVRRIHESPF